MRKEATFLVAAALLHAGIPLMARLAPRADALTRIETVPLHPMEAIEIPIEPLREPPPPAPTEPSAPVEPSPPTSEPRAAAATAPRGAAGSPEPSPIPEPAATTAPNAPPGRAPDQYDALPEGPGDGIARAPGIGGPAVWSLPGAMPAMPRAAPAPTVSPGPRPVDHDIAGIVLRDALRENDKRKGIDNPGSGTVASAVGSAVRGTETPNVGRATFEVRVSADGRVIGVRVASASGGTADVWDRAAKAAAAALAGKSIQLSSDYTKGALVYVDVSSVIALPSGGTSAVAQEGSGMKFDASDIGAHKSRSVKTSFRTVAVR